MAVKDVDVSELDVLKAYSTKLGDFKAGTLIGGGYLIKKIHDLKQKLEEQQRELARLQNLAEERTRALRDRYNRALDIDSGCRDVIGNSDEEADDILDQINEHINTATSNIQRMEMLLENMMIRTKGFVEQVPNMVGHSKDVLGKKIALIEEYKELHK